MIPSNSNTLLAPLPQAPICGGWRIKGLVARQSEGKPLVTVVTAIFNGKQYVAGCLESVLSQDYPNIEHIVFDGGSTDGTLDVLREYDDRIAFWKSEPDNGIYDAWNKALADAHGDWVCFLGVDDEFLPGAISAYMALAEENPQAEYLSSKVKFVHISGFERIIGRTWAWKKFRKIMCTAHVGSMHRRSLFDKLGTYDTSFRIVGDYELLLRARSKLKSAYMPVITAMMRAEGASSNYNSLEEATRAQILSGGRNKTLALMDLRVAKTKYALRPLHYAIRRIFGS